MRTFEIIARGASAADVFIYGDIGASWNEESVTAATFVRDLNALDAQTINVRINSYGGAVSDALAIYNALQRHPAEVNTHVDGVAVSAASLIAMAGKTMTIAQNGMLMIHGPSAMAAGNAQTMREMADVLDKYAQAMAPSYAAKTGRPTSEMLALLTDGEDHWYTATEAQAAGFADDIAAAAPVEAHFDLGRYRGVPAAAAAFARRSDMDRNNPAAAPTAANTPQPIAATPEPAPAPTAGTPLQVVSPSGRTLEQNREIQAAFTPFMARDGIRAVYDGILLDPSVTVDQARAQLLVALGRDTTPATPAAHVPRVEMGESEAEKFRGACTSAIMARAQLATTQEIAALGANPFRGMRLVEIARTCAERAGVNTRGMSQMDIVASAFTQGTSDFPVLLENTMHKALQSAYATQPDTWSRFCARGTVSDFRAHNRYRLGSFGALEAINELGEFKNKSIPDGEKATISIGTKGNVINLSRQAVINDDLGAFVGLAAMLGRAARRTVEADVYDLLGTASGAGPTMADGHAMFSTEHANNQGTGGIPSVATFHAGRVAMAGQKDVSGNDYLDLRPAIWVGSMAWGGTARVVNGAIYDPDTANKLQRPNMVAGMLMDIVDTPRISGNGWYLFADPGIAPVIEVAFLDGNDTPYIELEQGFEVDGARYKVRLDYGVGVVDYRGAYRNVGASS